VAIALLQVFQSGTLRQHRGQHPEAGDRTGRQYCAHPRPGGRYRRARFLDRTEARRPRPPGGMVPPSRLPTSRLTSPLLPAAAAAAAHGLDGRPPDRQGLVGAIPAGPSCPVARRPEKEHLGEVSWPVHLAHGDLRGLLAAATCGLIARLAYIQILHHDRYTLRGPGRALRVSTHPLQPRRHPRPQRLPLATTIDAFDIYVDRRLA
jgi:hypothetical protein